MVSLEQALVQTLANAVKAPYYRRSFGQRWRRVRTLDDLARLPILDKPTAIAHQSALVVGRRPPGFGIASSGTTRLDLEVPPLNLLTSPEELDAIAAGPPGPDRHHEPDPWPGWTLVVTSVTHGLPVDGTAVGELRVPWMYDKSALEMIYAVLRAPQPDGRRATVMRISTGALKVLTLWLLERGKDPRALGVRQIGTNSFRLSPFWRARISELWGAELFDNYSLSELATPATECKACGWLHFGWPPLLYEVLDLKTGKRRDRGVGRLLVTGLYPWVQKMPLIRYDTGDVVELGPRCAARRARGVRFLGRLRRGLVVNGAFVLAPVQVQDVLEALPETERVVHPATTLGIIRSRDLGLPRWTVAQARGVARLAFEVRFDPHVFKKRAVALEAEVRRQLLALDPALRRLTRAGAVSLEVSAVPAQSLTPLSDKYA